MLSSWFAALLELLNMCTMVSLLLTAANLVWEKERRARRAQHGAGAWNPPEAMSPWLRGISLVSPLRYFIDFGFGVILKGNGASVLAWDIAGMASWGRSCSASRCCGSNAAWARRAGPEEALKRRPSTGA
jgi:hypothetical protein